MTPSYARSWTNVYPYIEFDVSIGGQPAGRLHFKLYDGETHRSLLQISDQRTNRPLLFADVTPKTAANFRAIAQGNEKDKKMNYAGTIFHRVIPKV